MPRYTLLLGLLLALWSLPVAAHAAPAPTPAPEPVAIVAAVGGEVQISTGTGAARRCYPLDLVWTSTRLTTGPASSAKVVFFFNAHRETVGADSTAHAEDRRLVKDTGTLTVQKLPDPYIDLTFHPHERATPFIARTILTKAAFEHASDADEAAREADYLSAFVDVTQYPPIFHWRDTGSKAYRFQLFDVSDRAIFARTVEKTVYRYPYRAPLRLNKSGTYGWQVTTSGNATIVRRNSFRLITKPIARYVEQQERQYRQAQAQRPGDTVSATELLLVYSYYRMFDKAIHLLQAWETVEQRNPNVYFYLTRAYLLKGCPLLAKQSLEKELSLGGVDPVKP